MLTTLARRALIDVCVTVLIVLAMFHRTGGRAIFAHLAQVANNGRALPSKQAKERQALKEGAAAGAAKEEAGGSS